MPIIFDHERPMPLQRIAVTGDPKVGKTPFVLQMPFGPDSYLGEAVYWAADDGSESLRSCPESARKYIHVIKGGKNAAGKYDPVREAWEIIMNDWTKKWPNVRTMIVDTMTEVGTEALSHIADTGQFSEKKHITIGEPGSPFVHNIPMQGDYGAAQDEIMRMLKQLFKSNLHLIVIFHLAIDEKDNGTVICGGPATVGKATIRQIAKPFDAVLRLEKKQVFDAATKSGKQAIIVHSEATGIWIGGVRCVGENKIPQVNIPMDKALGLYWTTKYFPEFYPEVGDVTRALPKEVVSGSA